MTLRLTNYGKRVVLLLSIIILAAIFIAGSYFCLFDQAESLGINQKAYNALFIIVLMPISLMSISRILVDLKNLK